MKGAERDAPAAAAAKGCPQHPDQQTPCKVLVIAPTIFFTYARGGGARRFRMAFSFL
jgi:hypothetical protein